MDEIKFQWDEKKANANEKKHGITFNEAKSVFFDENARVIPDPSHEEERFVILGLSSMA